MLSVDTFYCLSWIRKTNHQVKYLPGTSQPATAHHATFQNLHDCYHILFYHSFKGNMDSILRHVS